MARTDPLNAALPLSHPQPTPTPTSTEFHLGSFHHYISGDQIGYALFVIIVIVVLSLAAGWLKSTFGSSN